MSNIGHQFTLERVNSKGKASITYKFNLKGKRFMYGTSQAIIPELWDKSNQRPTGNKKIIDHYQKDHPQIKTELKNINQRLENLTASTLTFFSLKEQQKTAIDFKELKEYLDNQFNPIKAKRKETPQAATETPQAPFIKDLVYSFIKSMSSGTKTIQMPLKKRGQKYSDSTIQDYMSFHKMFLEFEEYQNSEYRVTDISKDFEDDLHEFFNDEKEYMPKTKGTKIKIMKSVIHDFLETESKKLYDSQNRPTETVLTLNDIYRIEREIKRILKPDDETVFVVLDETEIKNLFDLNLTDRLHFDRARDIFLAGCYTALRHSDYSRIGPEHIKGNFIEIITYKNKKKVKIPIRPELRTILNKWENRIPKMTSQELGRYIKEIGKIACIDEHIEKMESKGGKNIDSIKYKYELITTHTARRSAATNMYYSGMPTKDIMTITGHSELKTFEKYIGKDDLKRDERIQASLFFKGSSHLKVIGK
mgnify:CR=1 FL=1